MAAQIYKRKLAPALAAAVAASIFCLALATQKTLASGGG